QPPFPLWAHIPYFHGRYNVRCCLLKIRNRPVKDNYQAMIKRKERAIPELDNVQHRSEVQRGIAKYISDSVI
ncbi:hypothetical protein, partial [Duncaniella muris]|uniref:hypothetical protein n=1 Tax=Duncaniella muris TaxID=2094150 RepID=UPI0027297619